eukprot:NODE_15648_length_1039_cov_1.077851.p1 GENE.NODE_15648_length_1039_cov_1.077851~~NODE_15648_length_1039_cov_1.077851.p1  ORF type:complete len:284 (+),score=65.17 NODE_15648_length_1039_cov_1.077851:80-931(+)
MGGMPTNIEEDTFAIAGLPTEPVESVALACTTAATVLALVLAHVLLHNLLQRTARYSSLTLQEQLDARYLFLVPPLQMLFGLYALRAADMAAFSLHRLEISRTELRTLQFIGQAYAGYFLYRTPTMNTMPNLSMSIAALFLVPGTIYSETMAMRDFLVTFVILLGVQAPHRIFMFACQHLHTPTPFCSELFSAVILMHVMLCCFYTTLLLTRVFYSSDHLHVAVVVALIVLPMILVWWHVRELLTELQKHLNRDGRLPGLVASAMSEAVALPAPPSPSSGAHL